MAALPATVWSSDNNNNAGARRGGGGGSKADLMCFKCQQVRSADFNRQVP